jgi:hypothetical protein
VQVIFTAPPPSSDRSVQYGRSQWRYVTSSAPPHTENQGSSHTHNMTRAHDFVVDLEKAGKSFREIQDMVSTVYSDKSLKKTDIYDFFLFPTLKKELAGITLAPGDFRKEWGRLLKTIPKEDFAKAFVRWQERCEKCIRIGRSYVEKS